jgi:hypothetical protein
MGRGISRYIFRHCLFFVQAMSDDGYGGGAAADDYDYGGPTFDDTYVRDSTRVFSITPLLHLPHLG